MLAEVKAALEAAGEDVITGEASRVRPEQAFLVVQSVERGDGNLAFHQRITTFTLEIGEAFQPDYAVLLDRIAKVERALMSVNGFVPGSLASAILEGESDMYAYINADFVETV